jgi:hypothetical protein
MQDNASFWKEFLARQRCGEKTDYVRFVVLGHGRSGSSHLLGLLHSHPNIVVRSELFHSEIVQGYETHVLHERLLQERQANPFIFLNHLLFHGYPASVEAVGYKMFYQHFEERPGMCEAIRNMPRMKILHLKRRNLLRVLYSARRARLENKWGKFDQATVPALPLEIPVKECLNFFPFVERLRAQHDAVYGSMQHVVWYEDLVACREETLQKTLSYLGLPQVPLSSRYVRQNTAPLSECIANYEEICRHLQGTPWAEFLEEERIVAAA